MKLLNTTHAVFSLAGAEAVAAALNQDDQDDWTYVVEPNPNPDGPETAIIKIYDEGGEFVSLM